MWTAASTRYIVSMSITKTWQTDCRKKQFTFLLGLRQWMYFRKLLLCELVINFKNTLSHTTKNTSLFPWFDLIWMSLPDKCLGSGLALNSVKLLTKAQQHTAARS